MSIKLRSILQPIGMGWVLSRYTAHLHQLLLVCRPECVSYSSNLHLFSHSPQLCHTYGQNRSVPHELTLTPHYSHGHQLPQSKPTSRVPHTYLTLCSRYDHAVTTLYAHAI